MIAESLINHTVPTLKLSDIAENALLIMEDLHLCALPVVDNSTFKGFLTEDTIDNLFEQQIEINELNFQNTECVVYDYQHFWDVLRLFITNNTSFLAVLNKNNEYQGVIFSQELMQSFSKISTFNKNGAILVLSIEQKDYSLSELSRIIENNGTKILSLVVNENTDSSTSLEVIIKLNQVEISRTIASLERYNYKIKEQYHEAQFDTIDKQRLDMFLRFLSI